MKTFATTLLLATTFLSGCAVESTPPGSELSQQTNELGAARDRALTPLSGDYRFAGTVKPIGRLTVDVIDVRMPDAADRLARARAEGAACPLAASNTYRCTKMHPAATVPSTSLDAIGARNRETFASFGRVTASPSLVSEAESLVEWQISQEGSTALGPFTFYRYLDLSGDLVKIVLPGEHESLELIVENQDRLGKWASHVVHEGRWRWHEDMGIVVLAR